MNEQDILIGQLVKINPSIVEAPVDGDVTPKGRRMGGCVGRVKEISHEYLAVSLDIHGGETWIPFEFLAPAENEQLAHYFCYERFHNCSFMKDGEEKLLYEGEMTLATAKFIAANSTICDEVSESVVRDAGGAVVCIKAPKGSWRDCNE